MQRSLPSTAGRSRPRWASRPSPHAGTSHLRPRNARPRRKRRVLPNDGQSVGKVEVRGPWITGSYYRDRVAGKFVDGWLTLTDRAKDVIPSGGEWIASVELENHIMGHPDVV